MCVFNCLIIRAKTYFTPYLILLIGDSGGVERGNKGKLKLLHRLTSWKLKCPTLKLFLTFSMKGILAESIWKLAWQKKQDKLKVARCEGKFPKALIKNYYKSSITDGKHFNGLKRIQAVMEIKVDKRDAGELVPLAKPCRLTGGQYVTVGVWTHFPLLLRLHTLLFQTHSSICIHTNMMNHLWAEWSNLEKIYTLVIKNNSIAIIS